ncbi:portal protein [Aliikangiella coralliicola]|uniref:Portal protein n=1 Tax=Aliikangiella coralliicola TaxID=2592383 RepID=A0A545U060_9GAMM|nr:hypothetical protein [Aliikangiella coralliicola]TQV82854.1 hypothetical protein FLL46_24095 [Aliikangiella coralliicola]
MINDEGYNQGSVIVKSAGQLEQEQKQVDKNYAASKRLEDRINEIQESRLAAHIRTVWEQNKRARFKINDRLINCMQLRKGVYDTETLSAIKDMGGSDIFMKITATKCRSASAWVKDIILPTNDKAWALKPTPIADIPEEKVKEIESAAEEQVAYKFQNELMKLQKAGEQITPELEAQMAMEAEKEMNRLRKEVTNEVQKEAKKASGKMETKIEDQLAEGGWAQAMEEFIEDFVTFPSAILKGPINRKRKTLKWQGAKPVVHEETIPTYERTSPFDIYPSPDASETNQGDLIEHLRLRRGDIYALKGVEGYNDNEIDAVLDEYGQSGLKEWLFGENERRELEDKNLWNSSDILIDGLHFWGSVQGKMLLEWGYSIEKVKDPLAEYEIDGILIGSHVIRAVINPDPLSRRPYHKASFQRVQGSWWGMSPPELMEDIQRTCNATARALINNMGMASGPMVGINTSRMAPGDVPQVRPWAQFRFQSDPTGMGNKADPPLYFFQPQSNAGELLKIYNEFEVKADDATNIPRYMYGNEKVGGAGQTFGGLELLMDAASKGIKSAIRHVDRYVLRPAIEMIWYHNMVNNDDPEIMGDTKVIAAGVNGIIAKDQQHARRLELLDRTANPLDMEIIKKTGRRDILEKVFEHMEMDGIVPGKEEFEEEENSEKPPSPEQQKQIFEMKKAEAEAKASEIKLAMAELEFKRMQEAA